MRVLLDDCVLAEIKPAFTGMEVSTVRDSGWSGIETGKLLEIIAGRFEIFVTVDLQLRYRPNLAGCPFAILIIDVPDNRLESYLPLFDQIHKAAIESHAGRIWIVS